MTFLERIKEYYPPYRNWLIKTDTFGDLTAGPILRNRDIGALKSLFASIPTNWSDRYFYSLAMSRRFPRNELKDWMESEPASADAHLICGARLLKWSWEARGYGRGTEITEEQWKEFYCRLEETREVLETCTRLQPEDPVPWAYLIMVAVYGQYGEDWEEAYFNGAIERDPENWVAHIHRLTGLSEKYGGSHSRMFHFANEAASKAIQGSILPALVLKAHSEYWKYLALFDDDLASATAHLLDKSVRAETLDAYQRSLGSNEYDNREALFARINAAGWLFLIQSRKLLGDELQLIRSQIDDIHWRWVGTEGSLRQALKLAGLK